MMNEADFLALVAHSQEAALGLDSWRPFGRRLRRAMDCTGASLLLGPAGGADLVDQMAEPGAGSDPAVAAHYRRLDPSIAVSAAIAAHRLDLKEVAQIFEMVPEREFRRSEYYADYARRAGIYHGLGFSGLRGASQMAPLRVHRPEDGAPFDEADRASLLRIKPFVKQALAVRLQARLGVVAIGAGFEALEASPTAMAVVDGDLRLLQINAAGERVLGDAEFPLRVVAAGPGAPAGGTISTLRRAEAEGLRRLARGVALDGQRGGRLLLRGSDAGSAGLVVSVMPLPARLADGGRPPGPTPGVAMLVMVDLRRRGDHRLAATLGELFGLSRSEAAVAAGLAAGRTAERIAQDRNVSLQTVRTQIRATLRKVNADGIRDLERIMALLPRD